jgi:hypothetical protein
MMLPHGDDTVECEPLQRCHALAPRARHALREDPRKPPALLLEGVNTCEGDLRFGFLRIVGVQALLGLQHLKDSGKGPPV